MLEKYLQIHPEVQKSISAGEPVVALESDIISHNIPYPKNITLANDICKIIRNYGVVPATTAVIDGVLKVGLTEEEIELLALDKNVFRVNRKDLPFVISKKLTCSTTVSTSMILANLACIKVLATIDINGVHKNALETFDISSDLEELSNTNVAVVCSGIKSILDIGLTLEYLETRGVPVIGYKTNEMPSLHTRKSGFSLDYKIDSSLDISKVLKIKWDLNLKGGVLIANPITNDSEIISQSISKSLDITLKENKNNDLTDDEVSNANIHLIHNNARLAANISKNLSKLYKAKF